MKLNTRLPESVLRPQKMELVLPERLIEVMVNKDRALDEILRRLDEMGAAHHKPAGPVVIEKEVVVHAEPEIRYIPRQPVKADDFILEIDRDVLGHIETVLARRPGDSSPFYSFRIERNFNRGVEAIHAIAM